MRGAGYAMHADAAHASSMCLGLLLHEHTQVTPEEHKMRLNASKGLSQMLHFLQDTARRNISGGTAAARLLFFKFR